MRATSGFIRLFIRGLAWDAAESGLGFADTLMAASRARLTDSSKGKVLIGSGQDGADVTYTLPPLGGLTQQDLAELCGMLLDQVDIIKATDESITGDEQDETLVAALLATFPALSAPRTVRTLRPDFSFGLNR